MATQKNHISSCSLSLHKLKGQASPIVFLYILLVNSPIDTELYKEKEKKKKKGEPWPPWLFFYLVALALVLLCEVYLALVLLCEVY